MSRMFCVVIIGLLLLSCSDNNRQPMPIGTPPPPIEPIEPVLNDFGLTTRPANNSCTASTRPTVTQGSLTYVDAFSVSTGMAGLLDLVRAQASWWGITKNGDLLVLPDGENVAQHLMTNGDTLTGFISSGGEQGLLGMAIDPNRAGRLYLYYTSNQCGTNTNCTRISRFTFTKEGAILSLGTEEPLMRVRQYANNHNGGAMRFGPADGQGTRYLFVTLGDGGSGGDPACAGQNPNTPLGKLLRLNVNVDSGYAIPDGNPYKLGNAQCRDFDTVGSSGSPDSGQNHPCPEIYASGLRNPFRISVDRDTGYLWIGDVGQDAVEEVDRLDPTAVNPNYNFGWPLREGPDKFDNTTCSNLVSKGIVTALESNFIDPVYYYHHILAEGRSVVGGIVYRGLDLGDQYRGQYFFLDAYTGENWVMPNPYTDNAVDVGAQAHDSLSGRGYGFTQDDTGEIYMLASGVPKRITLSSATNNNFPQKLSQTGCFQADDPSIPVDAMIPYDINSPLWSDHALKQRYMAIPDGTTIGVNADGQLVFPVGTVLAKVFRSPQGKLLETRLLMRHLDNDWGGYTYVWNDQQTEATLVLNETYLAKHDWNVPSREQCLLCHTQAAGRSLGPEIAQLNRDHHYKKTNFLSNQLRTLSHIGMLASPIEEPLSEPALADPSDPLADNDAAARAYLHVNCAHCHRPGNVETNSAMDLRYWIPMDQTNSCDVFPTQMKWGDNIKLIKPGLPGESLIFLRQQALDDTRMPPIGTKILDNTGLSVLQTWIESISCGP